MVIRGPSLLRLLGDSDRIFDKRRSVRWVVESGRLGNAIFCRKLRRRVTNGVLPYEFLQLRLVAAPIIPVGPVDDVQKASSPWNVPKVLEMPPPARWRSRGPKRSEITIFEKPEIGRV